MLPSTGLFREIICPFFDDGQCSRPFCHFKHAKKDGNDPVPAKPKYCPTPLTHPANKEDNEFESSRKKPKLEYIPLPTLRTQMEYKPQSNQSNADEESGEDPPMSPIEDDPLKPELEKDETVIKDQPKSCKPEQLLTDLVDSQNKENVENTPTTKETSSNVLLVSEEKNNEPSESEKKPEKEKDRSRSSSHSSSSRHKHKSSSHKSSQSDKHKGSSSSSSKKRSSSSDIHKHKENKEKSSSHHKSSKHKSSRHRSSSSSSKSKHSSSHNDSNTKQSNEKVKDREEKKNKENEKEKEKKQQEGKPEDSKLLSPELDISGISDVDVSSDEDTVMQQCKQIFEEYTPNQNGKNIVQEPVKPNVPVEEDTAVDITAKKRVAYEGAVRPLLQAPARNHKLNAMQQIYHRQEAIRKVMEAQKAAKVEQFPVPVKSRPNIAPVSNMLAFKYAKEKIEALKKSSNPVPSTSSGITDSARTTTAQTASKFYARKAHVVKSDSDSKPSPPVLDPTSSKISFNLRMQYYNMMVKECLVIYDSCEDAWSRAQTEELAVQKKCNTANIYKSSALLTINKLKKEARDAGNSLVDKNKIESHDVLLAGKQGQNITWSVNKKLRKDTSQVIGNFDIMPGEKAYKLVLDCIATEEQLRQYGYPRPSSKPGKAQMYTPKPPLPPSRNDERYCSRCAKVFKLDVYDEICVDECNYHPKSAGFRRGSADNFHYCCQLPAGSPGCMYGNYHVTDYLDYDNLKGFVRTMQKDTDYVPKKSDIFAFDCEMCYTRSGLELTRITVVNFDEKVVYDSFVKPDAEIVDYNTRYSGITEESLANVKTSIREVQAVLLSMFHADTILIGHSLESDMKAVKLLHDKIVDTSMLYPHKMGFPKKRALKTLCIENLKKIIQENDSGHDSAEDAVVCIQLVKHYLRNRIV